jgi:hypothetical protein
MHAYILRILIKIQKIRVTQNYSNLDIIFKISFYNLYILDKFNEFFTLIRLPKIIKNNVTNEFVVRLFLVLIEFNKFLFEIFSYLI